MGILQELRESFRSGVAKSNSDVTELKMRGARSGQSVGTQSLIDFLNLGGTSKSALSEATYFACLKVLSEAVGKLPLKLYQYTEKDGVKVAYEHPLYQVISVRPNPHQSATVFWSTMEYNRNHYGNAYAWIRGLGKKQELYILPPDRVKIYYDNKGQISTSRELWYLYTDGDKTYTIAHDQILHFKSSNTLDGIVGVSVNEQLASTIQGNNESQEYLNKLYKSGMNSKAVLQYTGELSDANTKAFVKGIEKYAKGTMSEEGFDNIIPIPVGSSLTPFSVDLADNQFLQLRQYSALQIASAFGIKPNQIGDYTKSSYSSAEAQQLAFYVDTLLFILKQYEEEITYKMIPDSDITGGLYVKFNVGVMLRADMKTLYETLGKAVSSFLITPNEAREYLDKQAVPHGNKLVGNGATIPIDLVGTQYLKSPESSPDLPDESEESDGSDESDEDGRKEDE